MISEQLKELLQKEKLQQKELANQLDIKAANISRYMNGTSPSAEFFEAMYKRGIDLNWLISGEGEMYREATAKQTEDIGSLNTALRQVFKHVDDEELSKLLLNALQKSEGSGL